MTSTPELAGVPVIAFEDTPPPSEIDSWQQAVEYRAGLVLREIIELDAWARTTDASEQEREQLLVPYKRMLRHLHGPELEYARLADRADLIVHLRGPAADVEAPSVSTLAKLFTDWRATVNRLARSLAEYMKLKAPEEVDLGFAGMCRGSIVVGFSVAKPASRGLLPEVVSEDAPFKAVRDALRLLTDASSGIVRQAPLEDIESLMPSPKLRDLALTSVHRLAPSRQSGIERIELGGRNLRAAALTVHTRRSAHAMIKTSQQRPALSKAPGVFRGTIRELDLDEHRFDLRAIGETASSVRCAYSPQFPEATVRSWLGKQAEVSGTVEKDRDGVPSMMWMQDIEIEDEDSGEIEDADSGLGGGAGSGDGRGNGRGNGGVRG